MSMGREYMEEHEWYEFDLQGLVEDEAKSKIWTTRDGSKIPVENMTTSHIKNTIAHIKRIDKIDFLEPWVRVFKEELKRRGEK